MGLGMNAKTSWVLAAIWVLVPIACGQTVYPPSVEWQRSFGGTNDDRLRSLSQTADGGYVLGGFSNSGINGNKSSTNFGHYDFLIVRLDAAGNKVWDRSFGSSSEDVLFSLQQTSDGGFILGGYSTNSGGGPSGNKTAPSYGNFDFWLVRTDGDGNKVWDRSFGGTGLDQMRVVRQTTDGGFILGGQSLSAPGGNKTSPLYGTNDFWVVRTDTNGNKVWDRSFGGIGADRLQDLQQTSDGGFILGGVSLSSPSGNKTATNFGLNDMWLVRTDSDGNKLWDRSYGGTQNDELLSLQQTADGGFILGGFSFSDLSGNKTNGNFGQGGPLTTDFWIVRTDANGNKLWDISFGGREDDSCRSLQQTPDGGFILGGASSSGITGNKSTPSFGAPDFWIARTAANGSKVWDQSFGGSGDDGSWGLQQTTDGGFIFGGGSDSSPGGNKTSPSFGNYDFWVVKLRSERPRVRIPPQQAEDIRSVGCRLFLSGVSSNYYRTEYSSNLMTWTALQTNQATSAEVEIVDRGATNPPFRFYRARLLP